LLLTAAEDTGAVAARAAVNTTLAAAMGAATALFTGALWNGHKGELAFELPLAMNGALGGLVAITAGCGTMEMWGAVITGCIAGWIYMLGSQLLERLRIDDAVDAIPVHLFNGAWGLIATGLFSSSEGMRQAFGTDERVGLILSIARVDFDFTMLCNQVYALLFITGFTAIVTSPFFFALNWLGWFRADMVEELAGLDFSYHAQALEKSAVRDLQNAQRDDDDDDDDDDEDGSELTRERDEDDSRGNGFPFAG
jgi:Amt family ammonium transporter